MDVDGYLLDEDWTADSQLPWVNLADPELYAPRPAPSVHRVAHVSQPDRLRSLSRTCPPA